MSIYEQTSNSQPTPESREMFNQALQGLAAHAAVTSSGEVHIVYDDAPGVHEVNCGITTSYHDGEFDATLIFSADDKYGRHKTIGTDAPTVAAKRAQAKSVIGGLIADQLPHVPGDEAEWLLDAWGEIDAPREGRYDKLTNLIVRGPYEAGSSTALTIEESWGDLTSIKFRQVQPNQRYLDDRSVMPLVTLDLQIPRHGSTPGTELSYTKWSDGLEQLQEGNIANTGRVATLENTVTDAKLRRLAHRISDVTGLLG